MRLLASVFCAMLVSLHAMATCHGMSDDSCPEKNHDTTENDTRTMKKITISVNGRSMTATLADNSSATALVALLEQGPLTYNAHDYGNFEKVGDIGHTLPRNDEYITTVPGDIILYLGNNICIYYDTNEWNFTRLGRIDTLSASEIRSILGTGDCTITLSLAGTTSVEKVKTGTKSAATAVRSLDGKALEKIPAKGIYIENGIKKSRK